MDFSALLNNYSTEKEAPAPAPKQPKKKEDRTARARLSRDEVALRDALAGVDIPCIEVHISNVYAREPFRHHSYISDIAEAVISGLGSFGYDCALAAVLQSLDTHCRPH